MDGYVRTSSVRKEDHADQAARQEGAVWATFLLRQHRERAPLRPGKAHRERQMGLEDTPPSVTADKSTHSRAGLHDKRPMTDPRSGQGFMS